MIPSSYTANKKQGRYAYPILFCLCLLSITALKTQTASAQQNPPAISGEKGGFGISPARIEIELPDSGIYNDTFEVVSFDDKPIEIELSIGHWGINQDNEVEVIAPTEQSLDQWLIINPLNFTLAPGGTQTVRFGIRPRVKPEIGEHRAMVYVRDKTPSSPSESSGIRLKITYGLPIYANYGPVSRKAIVHATTLTQQQDAIILNLDLENKGLFYARPQGFIGIWKDSNYPGTNAAKAALANNEPDIDGQAYAIESKPILPLNRRNQISSAPLEGLPAGKYIADAYIDIEGDIIHRSLKFTIQ